MISLKLLLVLMSISSLMIYARYNILYNDKSCDIFYLQC